ncbi:efflux RND transporter periplasmic adaptor subunit [Pseudoluteimonas lycopersici]|uniref:Efflux RND transporter periplasmic adaptor subunit n=1 Tax=Pseudoluteimonas lycopersici TaxID=1324796 RepID=A0A516V6D7_9GAMM|nr:efflux RND transporter periplasmic adaptor subunit [Lysobacter lycopersici]QDQ74077.1 efflux RND transporter periplasmic adaptor subunit [Lysobacter lycopersici]
MRLPPLPRRALLLVLWLAAVGITACKRDPAPTDAGTSGALAVTTAPATPRTLAQGVTVSGAVAAVEDMQLGVEVSGLRVTSLDVDVGQTVKRGQLLLTLDHRTLDADLAQAEAALREAEAGAALARSNLARGEQLAGGKYISAGQLDELRATRTQAEARLSTARAARDASALRRSFADLRAPAAGIISKRLVQPGQVVAAGTELLRLIRDGRLEWRAELPASQLALVGPGDLVRLHGRDGNDVTGRVRAVSPGVDADTRTGTVYADLPQPDGLQTGTYLEGRIESGNTQALAVPTAAVVLRDGFPCVFTVDAQGKAQQRRIETGSADGGWTEVRSGLKVGERVVVEGAGFLTDGDPVRAVAATHVSTTTMTPAEIAAAAAITPAEAAARVAEAAAAANDKAGKR